MKFIGYSLFILNFCYCRAFLVDVNEEERARQFLEKYDTEAAGVTYLSVLKAWTYNTNLTDYNSEQMVSYVFLFISLYMIFKCITEYIMEGL